QALALLSAGDTKGYQQACARMAKKFTGRDDASRRALAGACALAPEALTDYKSLLEVVQAAALGAPNDREEQVRLAALLLRTGEAAKAVAILEKVAAGEQARPGDLWLLVLAHHRAGQKDKAKEWQAKAAAAKPRPEATWAERQTGALWKREAEEAAKGG